MIVYCFNNYYPDNSGFGRRCQKEIDALSEVDAVKVLCRHRIGECYEEEYEYAGKKIFISRFSAHSEIVHRPDNYKGTGWYELKRNLDILVSFSSCLIKVIRSSQKPIDLYCVTSPLTIPILGLVFAKLFSVNPKLVSFHDLEPELAMHLKRIPKSHWLVRFELFLEKIVCRAYQKILVTTQAQANVLITRTDIESKKVFSIFN
jgi:hypothetical protein